MLKDFCRVGAALSTMGLSELYDWDRPEDPPDRQLPVITVILAHGELTSLMCKCWTPEQCGGGCKTMNRIIKERVQ